MSPLARRVAIAQTQFVIALAVMFVVSSDSPRYWQGWLYWAVFSLCASATAAWFTRRDPALIERRMHVGVRAETSPLQKAVLAVAGLGSAALVIGAGLEWRFMQPRFDLAMVLAGNALLVLGFAICFAVLRANTFAASTITLAENQTVISTGPYAYVRHPMYSAAMVMFFGSPLALQSWSALGCAVVLTAAIVVRLLDEEKYLEARLAGYSDYCRTVRRRLVPGIW
ncbi:methyltransferase family protein [Burkholderia gladioli]|uniref:Isoprenylcysteine carboxylmethyltransferase family protein n=1 Tax=Burkholderia gladioli TaxID=28095 RepID=A0AB38U444_BURGA|nr:isoprenylcysteine carboxylmethyltransferase family protein [Burkholderia gladioli]MBU9273369.1 isoprenylcysteine carboxylmethyltransferase family protein [Burkholderia gladioli]PRE20647.1 isoprenylcysteine carboxylmethyltransferase family protein [Burkholderia gladioli]UWX74723.1 isoprenylcysteine carboxylmethyltransferase family protein [Burkholderia gladioli]